MPTGERFYCEKISHRPPILAFQLDDPDGDYTYSGWYSLKGFVNGPNSFGGTKVGDYRIKFKDGGEVRMSDPTLIVDGLISGSRTQAYFNHCLLEDEANHLVADLHYNPWSDNSYK